jgi:hypothetical protein
MGDLGINGRIYYFEKYGMKVWTIFIFLMIRVQLQAFVTMVMNLWIS